MKKHESRRVFERHNIVKDVIFGFFFMIASYPRLLLEVFIRRKMGRNYFKIASAITVLIILILFPFIADELKRNSDYYVSYHAHEGSLWSRYWSWFLFAALFAYACIGRVKETYPHGRVYDFNYYSLSTGYSIPFFENLSFLSKRPTDYAIEVFLEPAFFFIIGLFFLWMDQPLGRLLIFSSICYAFSYAAAYDFADKEIQKKIDDIIQGEEFERSFVNGYDASRGVKSYPRPSDEDLRRKMASMMYPSRDGAEDAEFTVL